MQNHVLSPYDPLANSTQLKMFFVACSMALCGMFYESLWYSKKDSYISFKSTKKYL